MYALGSCLCCVSGATTTAIRICDLWLPCVWGGDILLVLEGPAARLGLYEDRADRGPERRS